MEQKFVKPKSLKVVSMLLVLVFMMTALPALPILPITAAAKDVTKIIFKTTDTVTDYFIGEGHLSEYVEAGEPLLIGSAECTVTFNDHQYELQPSGGTFTGASSIPVTYILGNSTGKVGFKVSDTNSRVATLNINEVTRTFNLSLLALKGEVTIEPVQSYIVSAGSLPAGVETLTSDKGSFPLTVSTGEDFSFTVTLKSTLPNTTAPEVTIRKSNTVPENYSVEHVPGTKQWKYTVKNASSDYTISVELLEGYTVTYNSGDFTLSDAPTVVERNKEYEFTVTPATGYEISKVTVNNEEIVASSTTSVSKTYKVTANKVTGNQNVYVLVVKKQVKITLTNGANAGISPVIPEGGFSVEYGSSFTFTVTPAIGHKAPTVQVTKVSGNGTWADVAQSGSTYTISNITEDIQITVTDGGKVTYNVTNTTHAGYSVTIQPKTGIEGFSSAAVEYGTVITIIVRLNEGYTKSQITVSINGIPVQATHDSDQNTYTVDSYTVVGETAISVSTPQLNTYEVKRPAAGTGFTTAANSSSATHGRSYSFTVTLENAYDPNTVKIAGAMGLESLEKHTHYTTSVDGQVVTVTITSVTDDVNITSIVADKKKITVSESNAEVESSQKHYEIEIGTSNYDEDFNVTVKPKSGYKVSTVKVRNKRTDVSENLTRTSSATGSVDVYHCDGITEESEIIVEIEKVTIHVTWNTTGFKVGWDFDRSDYCVEDGCGFCVGSDEEGWTFTLPTPTRVGFVFGGWDIQGLPAVAASASVMAVAATSTSFEIGNDDIDVTITGKWTLSNELFQLSLSNHSAKEGSAYKFVFATILTLLEGVDVTDQGIINDEYRITAYGILFGKEGNTLNDDDLSQYAEKIRGLSRTDFVDGPSNNIYCYYHSNEKNFAINNTYTQKITDNQSARRSAAAWVVVESVSHPEEKYVFFSNVVTCNFDSVEE